MFFSLLLNEPGQTQVGVSEFQLNEPTYATPPADPYQSELLPPITARMPYAVSEVLTLRKPSTPGSCVVTSISYSAKSSATRSQMYWIRSRSLLLKVVGSLSISNGRAMASLPQDVADASWPSKSRYTTLVDVGRLWSKKVCS